MGRGEFTEPGYVPVAKPNPIADLGQCLRLVFRPAGSDEMDLRVAELLRELRNVPDPS